MTEHRYGDNVRILGGPTLSTWLARLCAPQTLQPEVNWLVERLYANIVARTLDLEFPSRRARVATRMTEAHPDAPLECDVLDEAQRAVVVNLARAGTYPSHVVYQALNEALDPRRVRQDHVLASRTVDAKERVTGTALSGSKIGGDVDGAIVLIPDPMGATGNTMASAIECYKTSVGGRAAKYLALHLIVTPEYLRFVTNAHPDLRIYAVRVDRGLSDPKALAAIPGERWDLERGLNDKQYIVPGGGGFGEIMNNSFV